MEILLTPESCTFLLVQPEANGLGKLPLLLVEAVEAIHSQFESGRYVQQVRCARAQFGCRLLRQQARALKHRFR